MKIEKIKPIPKYMLKLIKKQDLISCPAQNAVTRYYNYFTKNDKELVQVTVAVRSHKGKWFCKQVLVHGIDSKICFIRDMVCYVIAGYVTGWYEEGITKTKAYYNDGIWGWNDDKYFNIYCPVINPEYIDKLPEFKYSAYKLYPTWDLLKYLKIYKKYPEAEYMLKMGLQSFCRSKTILNKIRKDKAFRKWLISHRDEIRAQYCYVSTIMKAYKENRPIKETQYLESRLKSFNHDNEYQPLRELFKNDIERFFHYIDDQKTSYRTYMDYLRACEFLKLDMTLDKNRYPHDFKRWHEIRIDEYESEKAKLDAIERKKLYKAFSKIAKKYMPLQDYQKGNYMIIIAKSPADLKREGRILHHCVGGMGYDQKFINEKSLIFFVRDKSNPDTPLVTLEYSLQTKKILQSHGEHNSSPNDKIQRFIQKQWLPFANKQLKQIAA